MEKHLFNLKFTSKQLLKLSQRCLKEEKEEKAKLKKAIQQGNTEGARIYAQNAIRKKNESLNYLRLSSRLDAVASKVQTAVTMKTVTKSMDGVVKQMDKAMSSMNLEQISMVMERFEKQFEDLDVQIESMEGTMQNTSALTTPQDQVERLMMEVADEHGLELDLNLAAAPAGSHSTAEKEQDLLSERLAQLRNRD
jgi:charged multivesicular body protein 1